MDISWIRPEQLVEYELIQLKDEGIQTDEITAQWEEIKNRCNAQQIRVEAKRFYNTLEMFLPDLSCEKIEHFINELRVKNEKRKPLLDDGVLKDKISGGWFGRAAGCLLGKPIEKYRREEIREILESNNTYPIKYYITAKNIPPALLQKYPWNRHSGEESLRENIVCMTEDDDMNYTMLNMHVLETYGKSFSTENIAETWLDMMPVLSTFTAERVAYNNLLQFKEINQVSTFHNPYREWIGAMIRADIFGWVSSGDPLQAAEMAFKDASLSHTNEGVFGEMFIAAAIAISFYTDNVTEILQEAVKYIPENSKIKKAVEFGIETARRYESWEEILDVMLDNYKDMFWVHSINNMTLIAAALVYGKGDYEKSVCATVMSGLDTDSSGATVGAILGTTSGFSNLPQKWIDPLNNRIRSSLKGFDNSKLSDLAERTYRLNKNFYKEIK